MEKGTKIATRADPVRELTEKEAIQLSLNALDSDWCLSLTRTKEGRIKNTFPNFVDLVGCDPYLRGKLSYNAFDGRAMISGVFWDTVEHPIRIEDYYRIREYLGRCYGTDSKALTEEAVDLIAMKHKVHPIVDYLDSLEWDGQSRLRRLFPKYLGSQESDYTEAVTRLLLSGAIMRVLSPGVKFDYCLVLADTQQGTGKSSMVRMLAMNDLWYTDRLKDMNDPEKAFEVLRGHWFIELPEMVTTRNTKDIESIKAFVSSQSDVYRPKYERHPEQFPRQAIFVGTTNKPEFLPEDRTGNRRFLPLICDGNKAEVHPLENEDETRDYIKQCYAECMVLIKASENVPLILDKKYTATVSEIQSASTPEDTRIGMIQDWLENTKEEYVCTRMIYDEVFKDSGVPKAFFLQDIGEIMTLKVKDWEKVGFYRFKGDMKKYGSQRAWKRVTPRDSAWMPVGKDDEPDLTFL